MSITAERPKKKGTKPATEAARALFLYGEGDGVRILSIKELVAKTGLNRQTIQNHLPKWQAEADEMLRATTKLGSPNSLSVPSETLDSHREDISYLRQRLDKAKAELSALPDMIQDLRRLIDSCAADSDQIETMIQLFDRYIRLSMNEKSLTKLFMDLKTMWDAKSGVDSLKNIQEATAKSASIAALKNEPSPDQGSSNPGGAGVFRLK